jgi:hypothetical protein
MKTKHLFTAGMAGAFVLIAHTASAQTWQTVDDYQYFPGGQGTANYGLTVAPSGNIFGSGYGYDAFGGSHALVMGSADGGNTWSAPLDDFPADTNYGGDYHAITSDPAGNVYAAGEYYDNAGLLPDHWLVRRSADGGATWSTTDDYQDGGYVTLANAIASDAAGNIYVAGYSGAGPSITWKIRKGIGGANFTTVDTVPTSTSYVGATAVFVHPTAGVFAAGSGPIATTTNKYGQVAYTFGWLVRRSANGGATWSTVDTLSSGGWQTVPYGIGADALGNIYVVGKQLVTSGTGKRATSSTYWVVRKSANGGGSWSTVENYQPSAGVSSGATAFAADSNGNLFVAGYSGGNWIVRENPGGSGSWQTVDTLSSSSPQAIAADRLGHVFV